MPVRAVIAAVPTKALVALGSAVLVLLSLLGATGWQLFRAHQLIGAGDSALAQCREDNRHQTAQLRGTQEELTSIIQRLALDAQSINDELLATEQQARARERALLVERQRREQIYTDVPECDAWRRAEPCREIADRMIESRSELIRRMTEQNP